jgi:hypothetical protein
MESVTSGPARARRVLVSIVAGVGAALAGAQQPAPGFVPLFDGTLGEATIENGGAFAIENGVLRAEGPEGWLRFPGLQRDFRLRLELRFLTDNADSGVFFRACRRAHSRAAGRTAATKCSS